MSAATAERSAPRSTDRRIRALGWVSLIAQVLIIATGGAVRLTGSGLGCPTWPLCTPDSLISTPEMGIHGIIEFGNRTLSFVVGFAALAVLIAVYRWRRNRHDLILLSWIVLLGIAIQGLVGGITVLTGLNPFIVAFHYLASIALVCVCATFLHVQSRMMDADVPRSSRLVVTLTGAAAIAAAATIVLGVLTTGAGPHSGDVAAGRNGFDAVVLSHLHSAPSYALFGLTLTLVATAFAKRLPARRWMLALLAIEMAQIALGLYQSRAGLPVLAVGMHLVLAAVLAAAMTTVVLLVRRRSDTS